MTRHQYSHSLSSCSRVVKPPKIWWMCFNNVDTGILLGMPLTGCSHIWLGLLDFCLACYVGSVWITRLTLYLCSLSACLWPLPLLSTFPISWLMGGEGEWIVASCFHGSGGRCMDLYAVVKGLCQAKQIEMMEGMASAPKQFPNTVTQSVGHNLAEVTGLNDLCLYCRCPLLLLSHTSSVVLLPGHHSGLWFK